MPLRLVALVALALAVAIGERYAPPEWFAVDRAAARATTGEAAAPPIGWVDRPREDTLLGLRLDTTGWALAGTGVRAVEIRLDDKRYPAAIGIARADVAQVHPKYPDNARAGFAFSGDFSAELAADPRARHRVEIVAIARDGRETVLAAKTLLAPTAIARWQPLLDANPSLASRPFSFLMMTSGIAAGGAAEIETAYRPYLSRTTRVGMAVPILYLRTTKGAAADWVFDPEFDLARKCRDRAVADDSLAGVIRHAIANKVPVQFILNGGIWADATCDTPEWDINDHLEADPANCQWTQRDEVLPDDFLKNLPGSTQSPELARSLTYNVYAKSMRHYKQRNLQAAAAIVAEFAREHPELFVGVVLDADTYMNPFVGKDYVYDYNPAMLRQFREWLRGSGPYAGKGGAGVPDLSSYRREPLTLAQVNRLAGRQWKTWDEVDPPRIFPGLKDEPIPPGGKPFWQDPWYVAWDDFRKHVIALHYDELSTWVREAGVPRDRIFSAQAFIAPDAGMRPVSLHIRGDSPDYDSAGVSIEGSIPRDGHLGTILYGPAAQNEHRMADGRSLFATLARMDPGWGIVEYNATDLKQPNVAPGYAQSYRTFRDLFNYDGSAISMMAWNGSNGLYAGQPGYVPYTSWRNTPGEEAMRDFLATHADLPRGARMWTFGASRHADTDGWSLERGDTKPGAGHLELAFETTATLLSPDDQVLRAADLALLIVGIANPAALTAVQVHARREGDSAWTEIAPTTAASTLARNAAGVQIPLAWPATWRSERAVADRLRIALTFAAGTTSARVERVVLYPRGDAK
jgi:hypothetical protein